MEKLQVYNASLLSNGLEERNVVHTQGLWHKTFHCWVVSAIDGGVILFQLRSKEKKSYPNMLDISAAGHLIDYEEEADGIREVSEELGIEINFNDLYSLGYRVEVDDAENGEKNREYQSVYLAEINTPLEEFVPQISEVSGLVWLKIEDALSLFNGGLNSARVNGIVYDKNEKKWISMQREVYLTDFIPRIQKYYLTVAIMADRLLKRQFPLAIS